MKINRPPVWLSMVVLLAIVILAGFADEDIRYKRIRDALNRFTYLYPQQKVFLHLDKNEYRGGDDLWIKAYIVNGLDHLPDTISTNLYVEIISPAQTRVQIKRLQMFRGFGIGDFILSDTLPEGLYQIRAFTSWMQNFDPEFYFVKNFQLVNPSYTKLISPKQARINKKEIEEKSDQDDEIDLQFMPEGGYLINGLESVVAFKAINKLGKGVDINGSVYDEKGNQVTTFKSRYKGIGTFRIKPEKDVRYAAIIKVNNRDKKVQLPEPLENGIVMQAENTGDKIRIVVKTNKISGDPSSNEVILVIQMGGKIYYSNIVKFTNGESFAEIPTNIFPGGILQVTAFSGRGTPLAERLVFVNPRDYMKISFNASDSNSDNGPKIQVSIKVTDRMNNPLAANLSLSITRDVEGATDMNHDNILSNLLLISDLKGYIEDPLDYFKLSPNEMAAAIDNLMLTQGWRRFDWNSILEGDYPELKFREERGITVAGRITRDFFNIPLEEARVQLSIMDKYNDVYTQYTTEKGTFLFDNLVYYDTIHVKIEAWRPSGRKNLVILLAENQDDEIVEHPGDFALTTRSERDKKAYRQVLFEENKEAMEKEKEAMEERKKNSLEGIYGEPDFVMYSEDFHMVTGNILDVMKGRVPGVMITGNNVLIRGINTIYGNTQPLFLVDGTPVTDVSAVTSIPIEDIERVEVLKGPKTSIYGARGANGVIAVFTKRGHFMVRGKIEFSMLGYNTPREFYQPKYLPDEEPGGSYTLLWDPVIITDSTGRAKVVFDKPVVQGNYRFDIQGVSYMGHVGFLEEVVGNQ